MSSTGSLSHHDTVPYEAFYGLVQPPFTLSPDPAFLYLSASHDAAIRRILHALRRREGFIVLSGDIGTGKTTLCRALLSQLDRTTFASLVLNPFLTVDDLLRQVLVDFGVVSRDGAKSDRFTTAPTHELASTLGGFLQTLGPIGGNAVLIVDEAQHLSPRVLEQLRVLSGLGGQDTRLQIVLVGQPNLLEVLADADLRQLDQRISLKAMLAPLDLDDVQQYVSHRLTVAGESVSVLFEKAAIKRIHALSGGIPRVINLLCDRALMAGAQRGVHEITPALVDRAADDLAFRRRPASEPRQSRRGAVMVAVVALLGVAAIAAGAVALDRMVTMPLPTLPPVPPPAIRTSLPPTPTFETLGLDTPAPDVTLPPGETPDDAVIR